MAWLLSTPALPSRQVNMADSWWMNFSPIRKTSLQVHDIWKDGEYFKWLLSTLDRKSFQQLVFKAVNNRKRSGYVDCQRGQIDWPKFVFLQTQAIHFETVMTTVDEFSDKTKVADKFILRSDFAWLFYCRTRWVNWFTIDVSLHVKFLIKVIRLQRNIWVAVFMC